MIESRACKRCLVMTGIAFRGGRNVRGGLTGCDDPVVTTAAHTQHLGVIHAHRRAKRRCVMTRFARIGRGDMGVGFSGCAGTVMTRDTAVDDAVVGKPGGQERNGAVANKTRFIRNNMVGVFAGREYAVVASCAGADDIGVVHPRNRNPCRARMATLADIGRRKVIGGFSGRRGVVMTSEAGAAYLRMVNRCRRPR